MDYFTPRANAGRRKRLARLQSFQSLGSLFPCQNRTAYIMAILIYLFNNDYNTFIYLLLTLHDRRDMKLYSRLPIG